MLRPSLSLPKLPGSLAAPIAAVVLLVVVVTGAIVLAGGDGPYAFRVDGHEVPQSAFDDELAALADNDLLQRLLEGSQGQPFSIGGQSVVTGYAAGWMGLRVGQALASAEVERRDLAATPDDRDAGRLLAAEALGGTEGENVLAAMPASFRDDVVGRWTDVAVLQRELLADPTPALLTAAGSECAPGRYVSHILVATLPEAQALQAQLAAGADFAEVARASSIDTGSAELGGQLGCVVDGAFVEPFQTTAATQALDVVSEPVQTEFGFHLILVTDDPPVDALARASIDVILGRVRDADVDVDPRYGRWDANQARVVPPPAPSVGAASGASSGDDRPRRSPPGPAV